MNRLSPKGKVTKGGTEYIFTCAVDGCDRQDVFLCLDRYDASNLAIERGWRKSNGLWYCSVDSLYASG